MPDIKPLTCPNCGNEFGKEYRVDGVLIGAQIAGFLITESAHGRCVHCGRGLHVVVPMKELMKLLSHYGSGGLSVEVSAE